MIHLKNVHKSYVVKDKQIPALNGIDLSIVRGEIFGVIGHSGAGTAANAVYPIDCASIAPVQTDANQQVSQIEAKLAAGEIDCISIEPVTSDSTTATRSSWPGNSFFSARKLR